MFDPQRFGRSEMFLRLERWFPERQLLLRTGGSVNCLTLTRSRQIILAVAALGVGAWLVLSTGFSLGFGTLMALKSHELSVLTVERLALQSEIDDLKRQVAGLNGDLEHRDAKTKRLADDNVLLSRQLADASASLDTAKATIERENKARSDLSRQMRDLHVDIAKAQGSSAASVMDEAVPLPDRLASMAKGLKEMIQARDFAQAKHQEYAGKAKNLELTLDDVRTAHVKLLRRFGEVALGNSGQLEKAISMTGLDVNRMVVSHREESGRGGPFIPLPKDEFGNSEIRADLAALNHRIDRWDSLNALLKVLPMVSPVGAFSLNSPFGARNDPINEQTGIHEGVDMGAPMRSPVKASALGRVSFAGWSGRYGRMVKVDHGLGVETRYAHLDKIMVKVGQKVGPDVALGLLGNTGRSTGAHLHYEVRIDDRPRDPMRFIKAGRYVLKEQQ
ncbi:MAG: peptidoglycan DD-metalloendopeptidase family protein [Alphaproteobacteria bacterium]|nr:peptidoglycan DD-metalloendopeptidase family protein [Alphaproteobacteria bacterium]